MILEKAWAKVRGNYVNAEHGSAVQAFNALLGVPAFTYTAALDADAIYEMMAAANDANYLITATSRPEATAAIITVDQEFSLLHAFEFMATDAAPAVKMYLMRDPRGTRSYQGTWTDLLDLHSLDT